MGFFKETATMLGYDEARLSLGYSYTNFNGEAVYIEGVTALLRIDGEETAFKLKKGVLYVRGQSLTVSELRKGSALVRGIIESVDTESRRESREPVREKDNA